MKIADYCLQNLQDDTFTTHFELAVQSWLADDETNAWLIQQLKSFQDTLPPITSKS